MTALLENTPGWTRPHNIQWSFKSCQLTLLPFWGYWDTKIRHLIFPPESLTNTCKDEQPSLTSTGFASTSSPYKQKSKVLHEAQGSVLTYSVRRKRHNFLLNKWIYDRYQQQKVPPPPTSFLFFLFSFFFNLFRKLEKKKFTLMYYYGLLAITLTPVLTYAINYLSLPCKAFTH